MGKFSGLKGLGSLFESVARHPKELTVYHGTPHVFAPEEGAPLGRFRMDKLGSGEGAQAFGHGLYFTGHAPLAEKTYRQGLIDQMVSDLENARTADIRQSIQPQIAEYAQQLGLPRAVMSEIMKRARAGTKAEYTPRLDSGRWAKKALDDFSGESAWSTPPGSSPVLDPLNEMAAGKREWFSPEELATYRDVLKKVDSKSAKNAPLSAGISKSAVSGNPISDELADSFGLPRGMNTSDIQLMRRAIRQDTRRQTSGHQGSIQGLIEEASAGVPEIERPAGSLYTVNLGVGPQSLLPYDYPIAGNAEMFGRIAENLPSRAPWFDPGRAGEMTGRELQSLMTYKKGISPANVSGMLGDIGIPGLYFERGGQRGKGPPAAFSPRNYNYVVWDEGVPRIVDRRAEGGLVQNFGRGGGVTRKKRPDFFADMGEGLRGLWDTGASALRGATAATLGAPGDIAELLAENGLIGPLGALTREYGRRAAGVLPTTERMRELLPETGARGFGPVERLAEYVPVDPRAVARGVKPVLRGGLGQVNRMVEEGHPLFAAASPFGVVKPKGGQWLTGSVEEALAPLKRSDEANARNAALNAWVEGPLTRYVKRDMATPGDPVRALAEQGILHFTPEAYETSRLRQRRIVEGFPGEGLGASDLARNWESVSDRPIYARSAERAMVYDPSWSPDVQEAHRARALAQNPWLAEIDPKTRVYEMENPEILGFGHLTDELVNAMDPNSGLPSSLRLNPSDMKQMGIDRAVRHVAKINAHRAAESAKARLAAMEGMPVVKEYPEGYRWMELKKPEFKPPEGYEYDRMKGWWHDPWDETAQPIKEGNEGEEKLAQWLKQEGDAMGHCVGGYCPDVLAGRSRIFSLRDAKGQPHVTIETQPSEDFGLFLKHVGGDVSTPEAAARTYEAYKKYSQAYDREIAPNVDQIVQIKGKQNLAPKAEYLPFVQDFVRSQGPWSEVGDLRNAGLRHIGDLGADDLLKLGLVTPEQASGLGRAWTPETWSRVMTESETPTWADFVSRHGEYVPFAEGGVVTPRQRYAADLARIFPRIIDDYYGVT